MTQINLSQILGQEIRTTIPCYFQDEFIGEITIKNPTQKYASHIKECVKINEINDELRLDMLRTLTNINIDVEINEDTMKYYNEIFTNVMIELDSIIFEISSNYVLETYSLNKMSESKKTMMEDVFKQQDSIISSIYSADEEKNKQRELQEAEAEFQLAQEKLNFLKGE